MKTNIRRLLERESGRYLIVGGTVYLFEVAIIVIVQYFGASAIIAVTLSFWLGLITSFLLQKLFTFSDRRLHHRVLLSQGIAFAALVLFNFGFSVAVTKLLEPYLAAVVIRTLAIAVTTIWNFYLYKTHIFKAKDKPVY
jgi:putative flippase GtrA